MVALMICAGVVSEDFMYVWSVGKEVNIVKNILATAVPKQILLQ